MVDRLFDEGVESVEHLATADPVKLLMRTNIEWKTILDLIDQANLFDFFGDKAELLRPFGIRGAIELASLQDDLASRNPKIQEQAERVVACIASKLQQEEATVRNVIRNAYEDVQIEFLWDLWGDTRDIEDESEHEAASVTQ